MSSHRRQDSLEQSLVYSTSTPKPTDSSATSPSPKRCRLRKAASSFISQNSNITTLSSTSAHESLPAINPPHTLKLITSELETSLNIQTNIPSPTNALPSSSLSSPESTIPDSPSIFPPEEQINPLSLISSDVAPQFPHQKRYCTRSW